VLLLEFFHRQVAAGRLGAEGCTETLADRDHTLVEPVCLVERATVNPGVGRADGEGPELRQGPADGRAVQSRPGVVVAKAQRRLQQDPPKALADDSHHPLDEGDLAALVPQHEIDPPAPVVMPRGEVGIGNGVLGPKRRAPRTVYRAQRAVALQGPLPEAFARVPVAAPQPLVPSLGLLWEEPVDAPRPAGDERRGPDHQAHLTEVRCRHADQHDVDLVGLVALEPIVEVLDGPQRPRRPRREQVHGQAGPHLAQGHVVGRLREPLGGILHPGERHQPQTLGPHGLVRLVRRRKVPAIPLRFQVAPAVVALQVGHAGLDLVVDHGQVLVVYRQLRKPERPADEGDFAARIHGGAPGIGIGGPLGRLGGPGRTTRDGRLDTHCRLKQRRADKHAAPAD